MKYIKFVSFLLPPILGFADEISDVFYVVVTNFEYQSTMYLCIFALFACPVVCLAIWMIFLSLEDQEKESKVFHKYYGKYIDQKHKNRVANENKCTLIYLL